MLTQSFENSISQANEEQLREALRLMLQPHASPVFGAARTIEHEVAALKALKLLGNIKANADEFDLVENLRVTKSKARSLLYQAALRTEESDAAVNTALSNALKTTQVVRDGSLYLMEVPDPLTMDRLRKRVRSYGFLSDGTFSGSIAKIPEGALLKLVEELIPEEQKAKISKQLKEAGLPDKTIAGVLKAMLATAGKKVAGEMGGVAAKALGEEIGDVLTTGWAALQKFATSKSESDN
jgi:hypothetical protein